ncbi:hypothetical protein MA16_Dca017634 [Dendrobium catenatum]|uniref:Uncharacterized protein n=1 Tax=Dendrobium catenatum TaxID=906689 RepID=A0A2I0VMQ3_9ASPA|nr:hypothetical protein MA16_Dca017634 [Dendrobium catenatum]
MEVISLGRRNALMQITFFRAIGFLPGVIKSRDFKTRRLMGLDHHSRISVTSASDEISEGSID